LSIRSQLLLCGDEEEFNLSLVEVFAQQLINGISMGMMYGLFAIGFTLVYGIMELINFSHFSIFVVGAFVGLEILSKCDTMLGISHVSFLPILVLTLLGVIIVTGILGGGVERMLRRFRGASGPGPMIASLGISFVLTHTIFLVKGPRNYGFPSVILPLNWAFGDVQLQLREVLVGLICVSMMFGLYLLVWKTRVGRSMRATRDDPEAARMMGVEVDNIVALTFFISSALGGVGGLVFGLYYGQVNFFSGYGIGLRAFTAAVLGGIGNPLGSVIGGLVIGVIEAIGGQIVGVQWTQIIVFSILIATMVFLPTGLLGAKLGRRA